MAVAFTGTKTGNAYVAGKVYSNGNGSYRANLDGSFTRLSNGGSVVGSSQSASAAFSTTSGKFLGYGQAGRDAAVAYALGSGGSGAGARAVRTGSQSGAGPGRGAVVSLPGGSATPAGTGVPLVKSSGGAFLGGGFFAANPAGKGPSRITEGYYMGQKIYRDPGTSDVQDFTNIYGEGEIAETFFLLGAVYANHVAPAINEEKIAADFSSAAKGFGSYIVERRNAIATKQGFGAYTADRRVEQSRVVETAGKWSTGGGF